jgi:hypothetical protein
MKSLGPIVPRRSLSMGKMVHAALAQWLQEPEANLAELFAHAAAQDLLDIKTAYKKKVGADIWDTELTDYYEGVNLGVSMMNNYQQKWGTPIFDTFDCLQPEVELTIPIPDTQHFLKARLDGIIRERKTGDLYILEHKTYSNRPKEHKLEQDDQFLVYIWAARQMNLGDVVGLAYDGMWSRAAPPRGSTFDDLFTRLLIKRTEYAIESVGERLTHEAVLMEYAASAEHLTMDNYNRRWEGCHDCGFEQLCSLQSDGMEWESYMGTNYVHLDADKEIDE